MLTSHHDLKLRTKSSLRGRRLGSGLLAIAPVKSIHASGGIDQLLLAGEKRVTGGANLDVQIVFSRRARLKSFATCAGDGYLIIFGVNCRFHSGTCL